jgi:hypothetical protein
MHDRQGKQKWCHRQVLDSGAGARRPLSRMRGLRHAKWASRSRRDARHLNEINENAILIRDALTDKAIVSG